MLPRSVISLFCDDIREEKSGMDILVGIYPEKVNVPSFPFVIPKLAIYTRINVDVADSLEEITLRMSTPKENDTPLPELSEEFISKAQIESKKNGSPMTGMITKVIATSFVIKEPGQIKIIVTIQGVEYVGGVLNVEKSS